MPGSSNKLALPRIALYLAIAIAARLTIIAKVAPPALIVSAKLGLIASSEMILS